MLIRDVGIHSSQLIEKNLENLIPAVAGRLSNLLYSLIYSHLSCW
jgi:hypothetical protein